MISMGSLFKRKPDPLIGLDISSSALKLVELNQDGQGAWILERCASEALDSDWVVDGNIEKFDEVADALKRLLRKSGTRAKHVALGKSCKTLRNVWYMSACNGILTGHEAKQP